MTTAEWDTRPGHGWGRRLSRYCLRHRGPLALAFISATFVALIASAVPLVIRHVVDDVLSPNGRHTSVGPWIGLLLGLAVLRYRIAVTSRYSAGQLCLDVAHDMRADFFTSLSRLDGPGQDDIVTGQVVSRSTTDMSLVQGLLASIPSVAGNVLLFVVSLLVMGTLSPTLTIIAVTVAPALWWVASRSRRDLVAANRAAQQQAGELITKVEAAVTGVRVVKGFGQESRELRELGTDAQRLFASRMNVVRLQSRYSPALQAIPMLGQVGVLLFGGLLALHGRITLGTFLAFSTYLAQLVGPVRQLMALLTMQQRARVGIERIFDVIDARPGITDPIDPAPLAQHPPDIEFDDVHFAYAPSRSVLTGLSMTVAAGETVAIVGRAGSGKSTIAALLARYYDPDEGSVRMGGVDLRRTSLAQVRSQLGFAFQDSFLFSGTIRANIAYGRPDATDEQIRAAARAAEAHGFIEALPDGYGTVIGEGGLTLSGGQRQRVALARALLPEPPVLILDDATSAVDPRTEAEINTTLRRVTRSRTTLLIAHRRSSLTLADRVIVLEHGKVAHDGTVADLEARSPQFRSLFGVAGDDVQDGPRPAAWHGAATEELWDRTAASTQRSATCPSQQRDDAMANDVPTTPAPRTRHPAPPPVWEDPQIPDSLSHASDPQFGLARLLRPVWRILTLGLVLVSLDAVAQLIVPALVRTGIDHGVTDRSPPTLLAVSVAALTVLVADWAVNHAGLLVTGRTGERLLYLLRVKAFAHLQRLGLDYYEREPDGRIMTRMTTDVDALSDFLQTGPTTTLVSLLTLLGVLIALTVLDTGLSLILVAMVPVLLGATLLFRSFAVPAYVDARERISAINAQLQENVAGLRVTQVCGHTDANQRQYVKASRAYSDARLRAHRYLSLYFPFVQLLNDLAGALVLGIGAARLRDGSLSPGLLIAFFLYFDAFFTPVQQLSQILDSYRQSSVGLSRLSDLFRTPTTTPVADHPVRVDTLVGEVHFRDVHFAYPGTGVDAISGMELLVRAGETIALVGETGAGKSTVVKLVARFYDVTTGAVVVDGTDLRALDLGAYRRRLGVVPQEAYLSPGSVRDAIAYGRPESTDAEVEAAAHAVGAHDMIAGLSGGYLYQVGERGRNLSSGQRQLLALARAKLVDPDILLLDEATASLDPASEAAVIAATTRLTRRRTTIIVAHRLPTAARAERIVVMDHGRVVEIGRHDELLAAHGPYAALWASYTADSGSVQPRSSVVS